MSYQTIKYEIKEEKIIVITMMRENEMNTLSLEMMSEMKKALIAARKDDKIKVVIITGQGRAFCCGSDFKKYLVGENFFLEPVKIRDYLMRIQSLFAFVEAFEKPVIAAINGYALGGGVELSLACDFRIMSEEAMFALPEISLGAIAGVGGVQRLPKFIGRGKAIEMNMLGRRLNAEEVEKLGLLYSRVPAGELMETALSLGRELSSKSPFALAMVKSCINSSENVSTEEAMRCGLDAILLCVTTEYSKEGVRAFLEKREPKFQGLSFALDVDEIGN